MGDLRDRLKFAIDVTPVPPGLETRVRARVREAGDRGLWTAGRLVTAAAVLVACTAIVTVYEKGYLPVAFGSQAQYIAAASVNMTDILKVGLGDHIHCAVFRKYPKNPPTAAEFVGTIGPKYADLVRIVQRNTPRGYRMLQAHQCRYLGRAFIHLTLGAGDHLLSLTITPKISGEAMPTLPGVPFYEGSSEHYRVSAFETSSFMVYFVSDLPGSQNAALLSAMAPEVKTLLGKI